MRSTFIIFGHEIRIRPESDVRLHITNYVKEDIPEIPWEHSFPLEKRLNVFTEYKSFVDYVFSRYSLALLNYGESALFHLEVILKSFQEQRNKFVALKATPEQLKEFDDKIYNCFNRVIRGVETKTIELERIESEDLQYHLNVMNKLKQFKIEDYYIGNIKL